jgi:hypothetical protein
LTGSGWDLELDEAAAEPLARRPEGRMTKRSAHFNLQADLDCWSRRSMSRGREANHHRSGQRLSSEKIDEHGIQTFWAFSSPSGRWHNGSEPPRFLLGIGVPLPPLGRADEVTE